MKPWQRQRVERIRAIASAFWQERNPREQILILYAAGVMVLSLLYGTLVDPPLSGRIQLQKSLPSLRQQAAQLQAMAREVATLTASAGPPPMEVTQPAIQEALERVGLKARSVSVNNDMVQLQFDSVSFSALMTWLEQMRREARLTPTDASFVAQAAPDVVNASLALKQQRANE